MENRSEKIANLQLKILGPCSIEYLKIISLYWELNDNFELENTPTDIKYQFQITQSELTKIIKTFSELNFHLFCESCISFEFQQLRSQSNFIQNYNFLKREKIQFNCTHCKEEIKDKEHKENITRIKKQEKKILDNLNKAIEIEAWKNLTPFEKFLLKKCIDFNDFRDLKKYYWKELGTQKYAKLFIGLRKLESLYLLKLFYDERNSDKIERYSFLNELKDKFDFVKKEETINESNISVDKETNEIRFQLTINEHQNHPDSPMYAGTVTFKERIVIEPGVEYIFGQWQRANESLYLTITPIDNLDKRPSQKRISKIPISMQKGVTDFLNNIGKNLNFNRNN